MEQIITRGDDELADALKRQAGKTGESVNSYVTRLLRVAVAGPGSPRHMWKAAAMADGRLIPRASRTGRPRRWSAGNKVTTPAHYASELLRAAREDR
jgi:plasmid stability protein